MASPLIILHKMPYSESSLIVRAYSRMNGKLSFLVKGAKRPKSKFRGLLEYFTLYDARYRIRQQSDLHTLTELSPINSYPSISSDLKKQGLANVYLEVHLRYLIEPETSIPQFECTTNTLEILNEFSRPPHHYPLLLCDFLLQFLHLMGLRPQFHTCSHCSDPISKSYNGHNAKYLWNLDMGGAVCRSCQNQSPYQGLPISSITIHWLRQVQQFGTRSSVISSYWMKQAENTLLAFLQHHSGYTGKLKSLELYRDWVYRS